MNDYIYMHWKYVIILDIEEYILLIGNYTEYIISMAIYDILENEKYITLILKRIYPILFQKTNGNIYTLWSYTISSCDIHTTVEV